MFQRRHEVKCVSMSIPDDFLRQFAVYALPVLLAITLHEAAHGYAAKRFGDDTAERAGRITLNPLKHIDFIGTIVLPLAILLLSGSKFLFGYAKPVPVDFGRLRNPKQDMFWVAAAGPAANLVMAVGWIMVFRVFAPDLNQLAGVSSSQQFVYEMARAGIGINAVLFVLNLLPLPPLDGGRIAVSLLPHSLAAKFARLEPYGFLILLVLLFTGVLGAVLWPLVNGVIRFLLAATQIL